MTAAISARSLESLLASVPNLVDYFYHDTLGPHSRSRPGLSPVPTEHSNWRSEQQAWRETAVLFDQSHHMPELFLSGPDALRLLSRVGINSFANFQPGRAKQLVGCNPDGQVIGDCVLHDLGDTRYELISGMPLLNWVHFLAETGEFEVTVVRDHETASNLAGRTNFRFGLDGPNAGKIFARLVEGGAPELKFFRSAWVTIAGCEVLALRHGMAGHQGVELSGPFAQGDHVRAAILAAGSDCGLKQGGTRAYFSSVFESGWIAYPMPAIYSGEAMKPLREWLSADGWESQFQLGGSFRSNDIADYYATPWDLGYEKILKFDHDFIGREALEAMAQGPLRKKVTLVWNKQDVVRVFATLLEDGLPCKYLDLPVADYAIAQRDEVRGADGALVGLSTLCGYSANEAEMLSLAMVESRFAESGTQVEITWGEPDGGSRKPRVERHRQTTVRATVAPAPYAGAVQSLKRAAIHSGPA